jgi:ribosome-associated toxin RatA of RatAB toxin-antitoxin module
MTPTTSGGIINAGGRRIARLLLGVMSVLSLAHLAAAAAPESGTRVSVRESGGLYTVVATFQVSQPPAIAFAVLTDYEAIPRFMPAVRTSVVLERGDERAVIEQEAIARFLMFSKRVHLRLEVHESPSTIHFLDRFGKSFTRYEGVWTLAEQNGQTMITYGLAAHPAFEVPEFLLKRLLKRDAAEMIEGLREEIARRVH